jgi:butyrate kinase
LVAHLGTNDCQEVERRIGAGDQRALLVYRAMAYQVCKEIGAMAAALGSQPDAIVVTGGLAYSGLFIGWIAERISFLGRLIVYPGEDEMAALAAGASRALRGEEAAKRYGELEGGTSH